VEILYLYFLSSSVLLMTTKILMTVGYYVSGKVMFRKALMIL